MRDEENHIDHIEMGINKQNVILEGGLACIKSLNV